MTREEYLSAKRRGGIALAIAAVAISILGLAGPIYLAIGRDPDVLWPIYVIGWPVVIGSWLYWLRSWRARTRQGGSTKRG